MEERGRKDIGHRELIEAVCGKCQLPFGSFEFCNFAIEMQHWFELQTRELLRCTSPGLALRCAGDFSSLFYSSYWHVTIALHSPSPSTLFSLAAGLHNSWHNSRWRGHKMENKQSGTMSLSSIVSRHTYLLFVQPERSMCICEYPNQSRGSMNQLGFQCSNVTYISSIFNIN